MLWEFLATDKESVESIGTIGAVLEGIFLGIGVFLSVLVFAEPESAATDTGTLQGENEVVVVLSIEERSEALFFSKGLIN